MPLVLEPSWTGRRVSVRRVVPDTPDRTADVVGDLLRLDAETAVIETRRGPVDVPLRALTHARLVPPSTADELALEAVAALALRPAETRNLDGWLLRADHGFTLRANSVLPLASMQRLGRPLDDVLGDAAAWYAERDLPLQAQVPVRARWLLDAQLGERGWTVTGRAAVHVRRLDPGTARGEVEVSAEPGDDWLALYRGSEGRSATGRALLTRHDRAGFAALRRDGRVVAIGRGAVDDGWLGVMAVEVAPGYWRQGLASAVMTALWAWGVEHGAARTYLQVSADNAAAIALYESLGYWHHHDYHYRVAPSLG